MSIIAAYFTRATTLESTFGNNSTRTKKLRKHLYSRQTFYLFPHPPWCVATLSKIWSRKYTFHHRTLPSRGHIRRSPREYAALKKLRLIRGEELLCAESLSLTLSSLFHDSENAKRGGEGAKGLHRQFHTDGTGGWRHDPIGYHLGIEASTPITSGQVGCR